MQQRIRELILHTVNPNTALRNAAEQQLKQLEKNPEALEMIQKHLMNDSDLMVRQSSSIFFANKIIENYSSEELKNFVKNLENNLLVHLTTTESCASAAYIKILVNFYDKAELSDTLEYIKKVSAFIISQKDEEVFAAMISCEKLFDAEGVRFNLKKVFDILFDQNGISFANKFSETLRFNKSNLSKIFMKVIAKTYMHFSIPGHLSEIEVFKNYFNLSVQIYTGSRGENEDEIQIKKWALYFLYKCAQKGFKNHFSETKFVSFIRDPNTVSILTKIFISVIEDYNNGIVLEDHLPVYCAQFFDVCASVAGTKYVVKDNCEYLLYKFIIPVYKYDSAVEGSFEFNHEEYLRERYNYVSNELRSSVLSLFVELVRSNKELGSQVVELLIRNLNEPSADPKIKYGIIGLLSDVQKTILKSLTESKFQDFIRVQIFPLLNSPEPYLISQTLYFMSLTEDSKMEDEASFHALKRVYELISNENESIQVEACLAMNFFFYNEKMRSSIKNIIAGLLQKVLVFCRVHYLDALNSLMDSIIENFTEDISNHGPDFVVSICENIITALTSNYFEDSMVNVSGYIGTIDKLIVAANSKPEIVYKMYMSSNKFIYDIFKNGYYDVFEECFNLMNTFLYSMERVDAFAFEIFKIALTADKEELSLYPKEISDFVDNYLSFGKGDMVTNETLLIIYNLFSLFLSEDEDIYDEDCSSACKIIESLMLNCGQKVNSVNPGFIPHLISKFIEKFSLIEDCSSEALVLALEAMMNCFIVAPEAVMSALGDFFNTFFNSIWDNTCYFKRVHDKKLFILFAGTLFKYPIQVDYSKLNTALVTIITSLPQAIKNRNTLIDEDNVSEEDAKSDDLESYEVEELQEDIYYSTPLDSFNAFDYAQAILSSPVPDSVGQKAISNMSSSQIQMIQEVLKSKQVEQKTLN